MAITSARSLAPLPPQTLVAPPVRIGLSRVEAADYVGVGVTLFDQMVLDGRMPPPKQINNRKVWHRVQLDVAFANLPEQAHVGTVTSEWDLV